VTDFGVGVVSSEVNGLHGGWETPYSAQASGAPRLGFRERRWLPALMAASDLIVLSICLYLACLLRVFANQWFPISIDTSVYAGISAAVVIIPIAYYLLGMYPGYGLSEVDRLRRQVQVTALVFSSLLVWDYLALDGSWSRGILLATWILATVSIPVSCSLFRNACLRRNIWGTPVAIVGAGKAGENVIGLLRADRKLGFIPTAVLDVDPALKNSLVSEVPVLGTPEEAYRLAGAIKTCAVAMPDLGAEKLAELSARLPFPQIVIIPDLRGLQSAWVTARDIGGVLGIEVKKNLLLKHNRLVKRVVEVALCLPLLLVSLPILALLSTIIFVVSPGKPFYAQRREGADGRDFHMYKLRSMYPDAEERLEQHLTEYPEQRDEWQRRFKLCDDPRVLPFIGNFIRKSSLDELPQILNVLRGEMSLVGPRPFPFYHLDCYEPEFRAFRQSVPPGLTGLWQVEVRSDGEMEDQILHDSYYIRNWSFWLDILILFKTVAVVVSGKGAR
jgi:Undecaprenyl-phosphate galactose phosphotransferase WbaP